MRRAENRRNGALQGLVMAAQKKRKKAIKQKRPLLRHCEARDRFHLAGRPCENNLHQSSFTVHFLLFVFFPPNNIKSRLHCEAQQKMEKVHYKMAMALNVQSI